MVTPPLTTSFMNFIVIEIHVLPRQNLQFASLLPSRQRFTYAERMIHSDRHESPTALPESMLYIFYLKEVDLLASLVYTPSPFSPRPTETKCRTGANSSSRKKGLTKPGSLTNLNLI
ncbi:hypothetical protein Salmi_Mp043 (mitochondrion) [Salvia miltiorrhiza]|uniref:Uncharacterized protein n=1 Tax=Salvia miltiorrhiza TaxID=226208 RepID=V9P572_SALMI|nr:hypothetical protein Salmi_Mp043 [Salvia miltiorrhiza]AGU16574.1 hypothetical protein Salmi_Mp043 [Salvia miltiorrhiza]